MPMFFQAASKAAIRRFVKLATSSEEISVELVKVSSGKNIQIRIGFCLLMTWKGAK